MIRSENLGPATFRALVNQFGGAEAALAALPALSRRGGRASIRVFTEAEAEAEVEAAAPALISLPIKPMLFSRAGGPSRERHNFR